MSEFERVLAAWDDTVERQRAELEEDILLLIDFASIASKEFGDDELEKRMTKGGGE